MNDTSEELTRELRDASQTMDDGGGIDLAAVKRSAQRIQRRRRAVTGVAAAAALAIAVPVGISVTQTTPDSSPPPPWVTETRDPSPTPAPPEQAITVPLAFDGLDSSINRAGVSYLLRNELHVADGPTIDLGEEYDTVTPYRGGYLLGTSPGGETEIVALDSRTYSESSTPGSTRFAVTVDGAQTGYFISGRNGGRQAGIYSGTTDGEGGDAELFEPVDAQWGADPVGYVSGDRLVYQTVEEESAVYVNDFNAPSAPPREIEGLLYAGGTNEVLDLVAGGVEQREDGTVCSAVLPVDGGPRLWESCDYDLTRFSPNGQYVIGLPSYRSGFADVSVTILDATSGEPYVTLEQERGTQTAIVEAVWEDDTHLLLTLVDGLDFRIVRLGVDGSYEAVTDPIQGGDEGTSPIHFAATP